MKNGKKIYFLILACILFLVGCNTGIKEDSSQNTEDSSYNTEISTEATSTEEASTESISIPDTLDFVSAWGNWYYDVPILTDMAMHNYNWEYLSNDGQNISYLGDENYTYRLGVDVSKYQENVDWEKVKAAGYEFAIIRVAYRGYGSSGVLYIDEYFHKNIKGAQAAGLDVGVYIFSQAINEEEAIEEAEFILDALEGYELQLPVVYDPELIRHDDARTDNVSGEQFTKNTIAFCETIEEAGYESMIYANIVWETILFDMSQLQDYEFWYADYELIPQTPYAFSMWQYSETGKVPGISKYVDLNIQFIPVDK